MHCIELEISRKPASGINISEIHLSGLAEAGLISSKLSRRDMVSSIDEDQDPLFFSPERCRKFSLDIHVLVG